MLLYKIIKIWFLPPGLFVTIIVFFILYLIFIRCWQYRNSGINTKKGIFIFEIAFCTLFAILIYILSTNACAQRLVHSLEYMYPRTKTRGDVIFVLGGNDIRTKTALILYNKTKLDIVVSGANGEAESMHKMLVNGGVPGPKIILEPQATNTKEHVTYMLPIALEKGYKKIILVTSADHMPRSMMNFVVPFKNNGMEILPYPCGYTVPMKHYNIKYEWIPSMYGLQQGTRAWSEYLGMFELWLSRLVE